MNRKDDAAGGAEGVGPAAGPVVFLARHGNTFGPGDRVVWVGAKEDPPLTAEGEAQARALGVLFAASGVRRVVAGPLVRTADTARIAASACGLAVEIDRRLAEIDFGAWGGRTDAELRASGEGPALDAWRNEGAFPPPGTWGEEEAEVAARAAAAFRDAARGAAATAVVSSGGLVRIMRGAVCGDAGWRASRLRTGHVCVLAGGSGAGWRVAAWDVPPASVPGPGR